MDKLLIFIVNPHAGNGKGAKVWKKVKKELQEKEVHFRSFLTQRPGHAEDLAKQMVHIHHEHLKGIIAVGGDGTIHEVINGMNQYFDIPVGFISAGSVNDFARGYQLPKSPLQALDRIITAHSTQKKTYDLGEYRISPRKHRPNFFTSSIGIGFDGEVSKRTNESKYKGLFNNVGLGSLAYVFTVLKLAITYVPYHLQITVDGEEHNFQDVWLVAVTNIAHYGGGMKICPGATPDDGILNICIVHNLSRIKLFLLFGTVFFGLHTKLKEVTLKTGKDIKVETNNPVTMHADGEVIGTSPITIKVLPKRYHVL